MNKERKKLFPDQDRNKQITIISQDWHREQEELKNQSPEEKTFRNYKCIFVWKYLLQYGFSKFFETEDWKRESPNDNFKKFDKLIYEREPKIMKIFVEVLEKYFIENPKEVWCDRKVMAKFLPKRALNNKIYEKRTKM